MTLIQKWIVEVTDEAGAVIDDATVVFDLESNITGSYPFTGMPATHSVSTKNKGKGLYTASPFTPSADDWRLIVHRSGRAPVMQRIVMEKDAGTGEFKTKDKGGRAATVGINATRTVSGSTTRKTVTLSVMLVPANEFVFVSGSDTHTPATRFRTFAEDRAKELRRRSTIDDGTLLTIFSFDDSNRVTSVPKVGGGFLKMREKTIARGGLQKSGTISIVDFYEYLGAVGSARPGSVAEASLFSHAFIGGPVLANTDDGHPSALARDASDADGRTKDFNSTNVVSHLKAAFSSSGAYKIWGCLAVEEFHQSTQAALAEIKLGTGRNALFTVSFKSGPDVSVLHTTINMVKREMDELFRRSSSTYGAAAANFLGISVFQAPPGVGASFLTKSIGGASLQLMSTDTTTYAKVYDYFAKEFGASPTSDAIDTGYFDFSVLAAKTAVPLPPDPSPYQLVEPDGSSGDASITLGFIRREQISHSTPDITGSVRAFPFGLTGATAGHRHIFTDKDPTKSRAFFVQADEKIFKLRFDPTLKDWLIPAGAKPF